MNLCGIGSVFRAGLGVVGFGANLASECAKRIANVTYSAIQQGGQCFRCRSRKEKDEPPVSAAPSELAEILIEEEKCCGMKASDAFDFACPVDTTEQIEFTAFIKSLPQSAPHFAGLNTRTQAHAISPTNPILTDFSPHFDPTLHIFQNISALQAGAIQTRLNTAKIEVKMFAGKFLVTIDNFFSDLEIANLAALIGDKEARGFFLMPNKGGLMSAFSAEETAAFFFYPCAEFAPFLFLFSFLSRTLNLKIMTQPWRAASSALVFNHATHLDKETEASRLHHDYSSHPDCGFRLPDLYSTEGRFHKNSFPNGTAGHPLLFTALMFLADKKIFNPETMGMGTVLVDEKTGERLVVQAKPGRIILFDGSALHGPESSTFKKGEMKTWRSSFNMCLAACAQAGSPGDQLLAYFKALSAKMAPAKAGDSHETDCKSL